MTSHFVGPNGNRTRDLLRRMRRVLKMLLLDAVLQSSPEVTDAKAFAGCWNNMTFCIWGRGVELPIDAVTLALNNQVRIFANLLCDVGVRYPGAFAVTAPVT
jgi:hypothetical protein